MEGVSTVDSSLSQKSKALLGFLKAIATLRRKRIASYDPGDKVLWFHEIPRDHQGIRSPFFADNPEQFGDLWLEVAKKPRPDRRALPEILKDWVNPKDLENWKQEPKLRRIADPDAPPEPGGTRTKGALEENYEDLVRLEREAGRQPRQPGSQPAPYESWFEVDVALELLRRNYRVRPQVEVAGYRIDLVVEGRDKRLAVECDGEAWHGEERFGQDMARQRQLERAGWRFVRVRESEFYADREQCMRRIVDACDELGIRPIGEGEPRPDKATTPSPPANEAL